MYEDLIARLEAKKEKAQRYLAELDSGESGIKMPDDVRERYRAEVADDIALIDDVIKALTA